LAAGTNTLVIVDNLIIINGKVLFDAVLEIILVVVTIAV